jgi:hypothetical protein
MLVEIDEAVIKYRNTDNADDQKKQAGQGIRSKIEKLRLIQMQVFIYSKSALQNAKQHRQ